jgi:ABC-2 type transport system ATP-binding protein
MNTELAIEIDRLSYRYKSNWLLGSKPGINNINLKIAAGEAFGFLGGNGAGKTTTIKLLLGLIRPDRGSCKIFGIPSHLPEARRQVGYIAEQPYFYDNLTVLELMQLYAALVGITTKVKDQIFKALETVKISHKATSRLRGLSKGQTQRVAMAQAILGEPRLLILDEPLSGLDPIGRREFMNLLADQQAAGVTIFMSSHILNDVESLCQRASILVKGEIRTLLDMTPTLDLSSNRFEVVLSNYGAIKDVVCGLAVASRTQNQRLILEVLSRVNVNRILEICLQNSAQVESLTSLRDSLESVFIQVTGGYQAQEKL